MPHVCPACGHENRDSAKFCGGCAAALLHEATCSACGSTNPLGQKFCDECGAALAGSAPNVAAGFKPASGAVERGAAEHAGLRPAATKGARSPSAARPADQGGARKVVTIIFADLIGSTSLHERLDPESVTRLMERYYRAMRGAVETHGVIVVKLMGDGVMAAFGVPRVAEDDAIRAVRAGVAMQQAFREFVKTLTPGPSPKMGEGKPAVPPLPSWEFLGEGVRG